MMASAFQQRSESEFAVPDEDQTPAWVEESLIASPRRRRRAGAGGGQGRLRGPLPVRNGAAQAAERKRLDEELMKRLSR